jgi:glycosyltransferase involved in cell wall biosynthesis
LGLAAAAAAAVPVRVLSRPSDSSPLEGRLPFAAIDAVIAGSDGVKSILVRGGIPEDRIEVVPPGVDFSRFTSEPAGDHLRRELGIGPEEFLVGASVPLEDERGHEALLEAAALVAGQAPKVRFIVLGEGSLRLESPGPEAARPMESVRYYLGFRKDAPRVLASLNMFTVFSHLDGLGGFLVEAMASGLVVAAADVGSARDLITHRDNGLLVPARNARALPTPSSGRRQGPGRCWPLAAASPFSRGTPSRPWPAASSAYTSTAPTAKASSWPEGRAFPSG